MKVKFLISEQTKQGMVVATLYGLDDTQRIYKERRVHMFPALGYTCLFSVQTVYLYTVVLFCFVRKFTTHPAKHIPKLKPSVVHILLKDLLCRI